LIRFPVKNTYMSSESDPDTARTVVQTYVPAYQREQWDQHAEQLEMSRSEYVKTMVQAGRRRFGEEPATDSPETNVNDEDLTAQVLDFLGDTDTADWDDLLAGVTGDIETRLDETLQELQETGQIRYSGRDGGYVLVETDE
jgi:hypothetical protein